ncbi:MAG: ComF family protein [Pirellulales bacterium]
MNSNPADDGEAGPAGMQAPPPPPVGNRFRSKAVSKGESWKSSWMRGWQSTSLAVLGLLFPPQCSLCRCDLSPGETTAARSLEAVLEEWFCQRCFQQLASPAQSFCRACAMPLGVGATTQLAVTPCSHCASEKLGFAEARTLGVYQNPRREAVLKAKQLSQESVAHALGRLLATQIQQVPFDRIPDAIVPVPMHWQKRLTRGTNPAESIALGVSAVLGIPCYSDWLYLTRQVAKQGLLSPEERRKNMRGSMAVAEGLELQGLAILIVDDVLTTGATASDVARALKLAGAETIYACALARGTGADS